MNPESSIRHEKELTPASFSGEEISKQESVSSDGLTPQNRNIFQRILDGYKVPEDDYKFKHLSPQEKALMYMNRVSPPLSRRHLVVIALSSSVGTGLFIGSGTSLKTAGAAGTVLAFIVMGLGLMCTMLAVGELSLRFPTVNPFLELGGRFIHPSWGFGLGWLYAFCLMITGPLELIAAAELTQYWHNDNNPGAKVNPVAWVALLYVFDVVIQLSGSRVYAELEFAVGAVKVCSVIGFMLFSLINVCGGPPTNHYIGASMWYQPSPFKNHFKGFITALISCAFTYGGTEISAIASAETANPVRSIPSTVRQAFWRIIVFFILAMFFATLMVSADAPGLGSSDEGSGSPFIAALSETGVRALPSLFNAMLICSVIAVSNTAMYAASRTLTSLAVTGATPKILCYVDRKGRPLAALILVLIFALLSFVSASDKYNDVFNWLYAFAQLSFLFAWTSICVCHLRFRYVLKKRGRSTSELIYKSPLGIWGSLLGCFIITAALCLQFWTFLFPIGAKPNPQTFFEGDLSVPVIIVLCVGHRLYYWRTAKFVSNDDLDIDSGVRDIDRDALEEELREEALKDKKNPLRLFSSYLC